MTAFATDKFTGYEPFEACVLHPGGGGDCGHIFCRFTEAVGPFWRNTGLCDGMCVCAEASWSCEKTPAVLSLGG